MLNENKRTPVICLISVLTVGFLLLFLDVGPNFSSSRVYKRAWDVGHLAWLFMTVSLYLIVFKPHTTLKFIGMLLIVVLLSAGAVELLQIPFGRSFHLHDVLLSIAGATLALAIYRGTWNTLDRRQLFGFYLFTVTLTLSACTPFIFVVWDDQRAARQFPELANFEDLPELSRWKGEIKLTREFVAEGQSALLVDIPYRDHLGAQFMDFPSDWSGFQLLELSVYAEVDMQLNIRIDDQFYLDSSTSKYSNRVNIHLPLASGWNFLSLPADDWQTIKNGRQLDLKQIRKMYIFASKTTESTWMVLDAVRLRND